MKKTRTVPRALLALTFVLVSMGGDSPRSGKGSLSEYNGPALTADEKQLIADTLEGLRSLSEQSKTAEKALGFLLQYHTIGKFLGRGRVAAGSGRRPAARYREAPSSLGALALRSGFAQTSEIAGV